MMQVQSDNMVRDALAGLEKLPGDSWENGRPVVRAARVGAAFLEIIEYVREQEIDLVVIGTHGRSGLMHILMGSVAERIVRKSPCPVLTVKPEGHQFVMP
jgi:nucleotide-binding universal stress UspA family protein